MIATVPIGQAPQALTYVPDAVPTGTGIRNIQPLGLAGQVAHLTLAASAKDTGKVPTSVSSFDQGLVQVLEASVTARPGSAIVKKYRTLVSRLNSILSSGEAGLMRSQLVSASDGVPRARPI